jgi:hypothetical protein
LLIIKDGGSSIVKIKFYLLEIRGKVLSLSKNECRLRFLHTY